MGILSKLPEQLSELMKENNFTPVILAEKIGVTRNAITRYLSGVRLPSFGVFVKLVETFNCSADFILGLVEYPPTNVIFHPIPPFSQRFRELLNSYNVSQYALHQKKSIRYGAKRKSCRLPYHIGILTLRRHSKSPRHIAVGFCWCTVRGSNS